MIKYLFRFAAIGAITILMSSCGNSNKENSTTENQEEIDLAVAEIGIEPEDPTYQPPLSFVAIKDYSPRKSRRVYNFTLRKNGMYELSAYSEDESSDGKWKKREYNSVEDSGKWTVTRRLVGDGWQKVYKIHINNRIKYYLPEDGEYLYLDWDACSNFYTTKSYEVCEVVKITEL